MTIAIVSFSVLLVILSNFLLENVEGQSAHGRDSYTVFQALQSLTTAVESLQVRIESQAIALSNFEANMEMQVKNLETKVDVQANSLTTSETESKIHSNLLNNLQVTTAAMEANLLNIFEEKFSVLANLVNNLMAEDQKQATSLNNVNAKMETQAALLINLSANINIQATSLINLEAEFKLQNNSLNYLVTTVSMHANKLNNFNTKADTQTSILNNLQARSNLQAALLAKLNSNQELQASLLSNLEAGSNIQKNLLNSLQNSAARHSNMLNKLETKADLQATLLTNSQAQANVQATSLNNSVNNLNGNIEVQATSLSALKEESKMQKNSLYNLESTAATQTNLLNNLEANADMQATLLTILQEQLHVQATSLNKLVAEVEWHEPVAYFKINRTIVAVKGDDVEMWCVVRGTPLPEIKWTKENGALPSGRMVAENNGKVLRIKNSQLSDEGTYVCVAANGVGNPVFEAVHLQVYNPAQECHRLIESDRGNLAIKTSSTACLWVLKLQNTTRFRVELDPIMTDPILVIPEQSPSNSNVQSIQLSGSKNASHQFEGKSLAIVVPPGRERTTLSWTGLDLDGSGVSSSTKLVKDKEGTLEWERRGHEIGNIFWVFDYGVTQELNWTLSTDFAAWDQENLCKNISFSVLKIIRDGNISEIQRTCDGQSEGSVTLETSSQVLVLLNMKSVEATRSKLRISYSWIHYEGIVAGTDGGAFVIPFSSLKSKPVSLGLPVNQIFGLAFDWNSEKIYFLKRYVGIIRSNLDGSESKILLSDSSSLLLGLTIEPTTGNLYYGNRTSRTIRVCNNDVTKCSTIVSSSDLSNVWDLAVHRSKGLLFWSIRDQKVVRANLDGSNATVILNRNVRGIDADEQEDRLYWALSRGVGSCDMSGQSIQELPNVAGQIFDVAIEKDKVYYGTWDTEAVHVTSKLGMNTRMVAQLTIDVNHITLFGTRASNNPPNPCDEANCAHLCVLVTRWSYRCTCPDAQILNADGITCTI